MAYPQQQALPKQTSGMAITSLVLGLVGASALAVIFGAIALKETLNGEKAGKGMAIAGLVLGVIGSVFWIIFWIGIGSAAEQVNEDLNKTVNELDAYNKCVEAINVPLTDPAYSVQLEACTK